MDGFIVVRELIKRYDKFVRFIICVFIVNFDIKIWEYCFEVGMDYVFMKFISLFFFKIELFKLIEF